MFCRIAIVLVIVVCSEFFGVTALKNGDEGVCTVKSSIRRTRTKIFTFHKWCGRKRCVGKASKPEVYWITTNQTICCEGWVYNGELDVCTPQCSTGCTGGRCVAPNLCECDPPTYLDPEHKNACIRPICDPPCVNANCGMNNTCHCISDFNIFNTTHCYQCKSGYVINSNFECAPMCSIKCVNGDCSEPNVCKCFKGFKSVGRNEDFCEPVCEKCVNSKCTAPDFCTCFDGYSRINNTHCEPVCDDCDGECIGPNVCACREGYKRFNGVCTPQCNGSCVNAVCTAPNVCKCYDGYIKRDNSSSECYKPCRVGCYGTCSANGECIEQKCMLTQL